MVKWKPLRHWIDLFFYHRSRRGAIQFDPFKHFYREKNFFSSSSVENSPFRVRFQATIGDKIVDTFTFLSLYFVTVRCDPFFALLACPFNPPPPQTMLCGNCCDLELQTSNIEWGSGVFCTVYCAIKRMVFFGALRVLLKDNVSTNYVTDCST